MPSQNMKGLIFFGHNDKQINETEDQNNSTFNSTIYGLQFGKTFLHLFYDFDSPCILIFILYKF